MKKSCLAAAASAAAIIPCAHAQNSLTLYGIVDSGLLYKTNAGPGGSVATIGSGNDSTSRWGLVVRESLGNGLTATADLESGFRVNTGVVINGSVPASQGTVLFNRGATVGLSSDNLGSIQIGKNRSPILRMMVRIDVEGYSNFGSLNNLLYQNLSGYSGFQYSWVDNSILYETPELGGFQASAMYGFGETAGSLQNKQVFSAGGSYSRGNMMIVGAYFTGRDVTGATNDTTARAYTIGANYTWNAFKFMLDYANFKNPARGTSDNFYTAELAYAPTSAWTFTATYMRLDDRVNDERSANLYKLGAHYALSKRTWLYSFAGYVNNNSLGTLGLQNSTPIGVVGKNQLAFAAGIKHHF